MKLKLDENLGGGAFRYLKQVGYDVSSVVLQNLCGADDHSLIDVCTSEGRCLVTLDLDFSNPLQFPPASYAGIIVLRLPKQPSGEKTSSTVWRRLRRRYQRGQTSPVRFAS
jgi:predicted nuclease of predicted toxin-antitoxin system